MDTREDKTAHVSYVEGVHHIVVPSQIKEIGSAIFVVQPGCRSSLANVAGSIPQTHTFEILR